MLEQHENGSKKSKRGGSGLEKVERQTQIAIIHLNIYTPFNFHKHAKTDPLLNCTPIILRQMTSQPLYLQTTQLEHIRII